MSQRIARLKDLVRELRVDALWLTFLPNIRWACGFSGSNGLLLVLADSAHFISDGRYAEQAGREVSGGVEVHIPGYDLVGHVKETGLLADARDVIFEADHLTVADLDSLAEQFPDVRWRGEKELLIQEVATKDDTEITQIRRAQQITDDVFEAVLAALRPGVTEKEVAAEIVYQHLRRGADAMSFEPAAAFGPNSALPHARPTDRVLRSGEVVLLDFGCMVGGYASDMTRTVVVGDPDPFVRDVYQIVLASQEAAISQAMAGVVSKDLDAVARDVIKEAGYGQYFNHGLGHGVGLQIHEWPRVSYTVDYPLPRNCVVSIEPGIYIPGRFGVRIEDLVLLLDDGSEVLTGAPKEWTVIQY